MVLLIVFALSALVLAGFIYLVSLFFQGYFYTEPSEGLTWQAPALGIGLAAYIALWCLLLRSSPGVSPTNLPYDTLFRFSPKVEMLTEPATELTLVKKVGGKEVEVPFKRQRLDQTRWVYVEVKNPTQRWPRNAEGILMDHGGEKLRFTPGPPNEGGYRSFSADKGGWVMVEYDDGPDGTPTAFRVGRFFMNLLLNSLLLIACVVGLWLLTRFALSHAILFGTVLWVLLTLIVLPMIFEYVASR